MDERTEKIIGAIRDEAGKMDRCVRLMEVCGTHTQAISRYGIREVLPKNVKLITGPGCPVCVTAQRDIDAVVNLAVAGVPIATYGDAMRVPGFFGSLDQARENGAQVFDVYSVADALELQKKIPQLVFFGIGFETTAPMSAWGIKNGLAVYSAHKFFPPAMEALLADREICIDGFIDPGHVSVVIGEAPYRKLGVPQVITGFEAVDILEGILMLLRRIRNHDLEVGNQYLRAVKPEGNPKIQKELAEVFEAEDGEWRGFGIISGSGMKIRKKYEKFDAKIRHRSILDKVDFSRSKDLAGCCCGDVIRGKLESKDCPLLGRVCTPDNPVGPCMVSAEGACNISFGYGQ